MIDKDGDHEIGAGVFGRCDNDCGVLGCRNLDHYDRHKLDALIYNELREREIRELWTPPLYFTLCHDADEQRIVGDIVTEVARIKGEQQGGKRVRRETRYDALVNIAATAVIQAMLLSTEGV